MRFSFITERLVFEFLVLYVSRDQITFIKFTHYSVLFSFFNIVPSDLVYQLIPQERFHCQLWVVRESPNSSLSLKSSQERRICSTSSYFDYTLSFSIVTVRWSLVYCKNVLTPRTSHFNISAIVCEPTKLFYWISLQRRYQLLQFSLHEIFMNQMVVKGLVLLSFGVHLIPRLSSPEQTRPGVRD